MSCSLGVVGFSPSPSAFYLTNYCLLLLLILSFLTSASPFLFHFCFLSTTSFLNMPPRLLCHASSFKDFGERLLAPDVPASMTHSRNWKLRTNWSPRGLVPRRPKAISWEGLMRDRVTFSTAICLPTGLGIDVNHALFDGEVEYARALSAGSK